ncbi:glycosyltransferase family 4 protein [Edwardsiella tarda]|uniref:glycosyltransferase family 4 protein n=1 Tax=Edwardsiella tarda TaxID=636 RepID=UPI000D5062E7|nr:glycosyltransferase family 4 protein [Edwardsiella tarda]UCQ26686.1 glycosyltransferase family 4 protein [Edwardsiella tarda]
MRIALICDDYLPDSTRVSAKMMHELACELLCRGYEPIVICPNNKVSREVEYMELDAVSIYKFPSGAVKDVSKIKRAINESLLSFNAWRYLSDVVNSKKIDGVIYYSPSIFFGPLVNKIKMKWRCKSYLVLRDSFPQWLIDQQIIKSGGFIEKYFRFFEKINYRASDFIGLMSEKNHDIFVKQYPYIENTQVLYNWANFRSDANVCPSSLVENLSLAGKVIFFYGGNIGHAQDMANLMRLVKNMSHIRNAHFLFIGQGDEVELVKDFISNNKLKNCTYLPSVTQDEYKSILKVVDVGLFSLAKNHSVHNFPGKLLGYMVNKLPILGSVNRDNDLQNIINNADAGYVFCNGEDDDLFVKAMALAEDRALRNRLGENAFSLLKDQFSIESAADKIELSLFG